MYTSTQVKKSRTLWEGSGFMFILQNGPDATRLFLPQSFVSKHWERKTKVIWIDLASLHSARDTRSWNAMSEKHQECWILHSLPCSPQRPYWFTEERSGRADSKSGMGRLQAHYQQGRLSNIFLWSVLCGNLQTFYLAIAAVLWGKCPNFQVKQESGGWLLVCILALGAIDAPKGLNHLLAVVSVTT